MSVSDSPGYITSNDIRYLVYARKSSESEDRQVQSIDDQLSALRKLATNESLSVIGEHLEAHSAKNPNSRPVFDEVLGRIERGEADGILCWNINRLSRNPIDSGRLSWLLQRSVIKSIRTVEREYRPEDNVLLLAVESGVANQYIIDLRKAVTRGLQGRVDRGWWYGKPPPGYRTNPETREIEEDESQFALLKRAWDMAASGSYSVPQILDRLDSWGFRRRIAKECKPLARSSLYRIFRNPFYYGWFTFKGELIHGKHQPMITKAQFDHVQENIRRETRAKSGPKPFLFGGVLRCANCGCLITGERKIKTYRTTGNASVYVYYRCTGARGCSKAGVREEQLQEWFLAELMRIKIPTWFYEPLEQVLLELREENALTDEEILGQQKQALRQLKAKLDNLLEMRLSGELSRTEFVPIKNDLVVKIDQLNRSIAETSEKLKKVVDQLQSEASWAHAAYDRFYGASSFEEMRNVVEYYEDDACLTQERLDVRLRPLLGKVVSTFEPLKGGNNMVQEDSRVCASSIRRAVRDAIRTLLSEKN